MQYSLCGTIQLDYILRHKEHLRYITNNNPITTYAMHILHNGQEFGPTDETLKLLSHAIKV